MPSRRGKHAGNLTSAKVVRQPPRSPPSSTADFRNPTPGATGLRFYEVQLGCTPVIAWDRADGQGVYYELDHTPVVEILGARRGDAALAPPMPGSFSIVVVVTDADCAHKELIARGATVTTPPVTETWGRYFGIEDPDGVPLYFVEQNSSS